MAPLKRSLSLEDFVFDHAIATVEVGFKSGADDKSEADKESESYGVITFQDFKKPWTKSFGDLIPLMEKVDGGVYKRIEIFGDKTKGSVPDNARVAVQYKCFWQGENIPFAGTLSQDDKLNFDMNDQDMFPFFRNAVKKMWIGEKAHFMICKERVFYEMGLSKHPPSDLLVIIEMLSFSPPAGNLKASENLKLDEQQNFSLVLIAAEEIKLKAIDFFYRKAYKDAIKTFSKAVNLMFPFNLTDPDEEKTLKAFMMKCYTNIVICFNRLNLHREACKIIDEVKRIAGKEEIPTKVFYQEGIALMETGDYENAEIALKKAISLDPQNQDIANKISELKKKRENAEVNAKDMWGRAFKKFRSEPKKMDEKAKEDPLEGAIKRYFQTFKSCKLSDIIFPVAMWKNNLEMVEKLAQRFQLKLDFDPKDKSKCVLRKLAH